MLRRIYRRSTLWISISTVIQEKLSNDLSHRLSLLSLSLQMKSKYQLMTFGIPVHELPVNANDTVRNKYHLEYLKMRKDIEQAKEDGVDTSTWIIHPGIHDVLFSKGGNPHHVGNVNFQYMMECKLEAYNRRTNRKEGKTIREEIIHSVKEKNGRFLELNRDSGWWVEITSLEALHNKINTSMYDHTRRLIARTKQQQNASESLKFLEGSKKRRRLDDDYGPCGGGGCV